MHVYGRARFLSMSTTAAVIAGLLIVGHSAPASADTAPPMNTQETVSSDALPTVQIDGVVWDQEIVGNTVYAGGEFATARPAGAAPGVNTVPRANLLSYDVRTGVLINSFAPNANARVRNMALSPDGSRLYVAGNFTSIAGQTRYRVASFDTATGALTAFRPVLNGKVNAIAVTNDTVYVVGGFTTANNVEVTGAAAYSASGTGALKAAWAPKLGNGQAIAVVAKPDNSKVILGGYFQSINGSSNPGWGLGAVDGTTGAVLPWNVNDRVRNADANASISSLAFDEDGVYGTGQHYGSGTLEGTFYASWDNGDIRWVEDCHGDTYSVKPIGGVVYTTSHAHYCGNIGGFPQTEPWSFYRALAFTKTAEGTTTPDPHGYTNWAGTPRPALLDWFPSINAGTFTGLNQGGWSVGGNSRYVLYGGEFTRVNNAQQQGLVRFASKTIAPNTDGPRLSGANYVPRAISLTAGNVRLAWPANHDRDNASLKYEVIRNGATAAPIYTTTSTSNFYTLPLMSFTDTGLTPGASYTYRIRVTDPFGNVVNGNNVSVTVANAGSLSNYAKEVLDDSPVDYWRLGESSGPDVYDWAGLKDAVASSGVAFGVTGAIAGDSNTAAKFSGDASGLVSTQEPIQGPDTFAIESWFKTTSTAGGKIVGFGNAKTGNSGSYDRHVYMDPDGRVIFGVYPGSTQTVQSALGFNDGEWHHVVANLGPSGMQLYVDGVRVAQRSDVTFGQGYAGYWRIGGDNSWSGAPYFDGTIDEVAIYSAPMSIQNVNSHYAASGRTSTLPSAPTDAYGARVFNDSPDMYWRLNESSGTVAADSGLTRINGTYSGGVETGRDGAIDGTTNKAAAFDGSSGLVASSGRFSNPTVYSLELWFKSTTDRGGKLIGFGSSDTGTSSNYDRHVYLQDDGKLVFGVWTGSANTITTPGAYTDGLWHHVVATQSSSGMMLFVDGQLTGTTDQTQAQAYDGYWRVGGDTTWGSSSAYVAAEIDEVAVYSTALSAETVAAHHGLGAGATPNAAPTASFTATPAELAVQFDGTASDDPDGTIVSYAWQFGDGSSGTGASVGHTYAEAGSYEVTLRVTDDQGATNEVSSTVTVTAPIPNAPPNAAFSTTASTLDITVDGRASSDTDGAIAAYAWDFGDGTSAAGPTASHRYSTAGSYQVRLTVTDNLGATGTTMSTVTVQPAPPVNAPPVARFESSADFLTLSVDGSESSDADGVIVAYAWDFGDGGTATTPAAVHSYGAGGTYTVRLTVTDDSGATNTRTASVTVVAEPGNTAPSASFTSTVTGLTVSVDASASSDPDGTIGSYAWSFGDGVLASGMTASHTYTTAGTYSVTLTVTDNGGAQAVSTAGVTVVASPGVTTFATDSFQRTVTNGLGTADAGGPWTVTGGAANFSVSGGTGNLRAVSGGTSTGLLNNVSSTSTEVRAQFALDKVATGTGTYVSVNARTVGTAVYGAKLRFYASGEVTLQATGGNTLVLPGISYAPNEQLQVRVQAYGVSPTTVRAKVWRVGESEPAAWQSTGTSSTAGLQTAGAIGIQAYLPSGATNAPVTVRFDNFWAGAVQ